MNVMVDTRLGNGLRVKHPAEAQLSTGGGRMDSPRWLCVAHEWGNLSLAVQSIRDLRRHDGSPVDAQVFSPSVRILVPQSNRPAIRQVVPAWPGYVLCLISPADWHLLKRARGVADVLSAIGDRQSPAWLSDAAAGRLMAMASASGVIEKWSVPERMAPLEVGEAVQITSGAFAGHSGSVALSSEERVAVLMDMMGRQVRAVVERRYVEPTHAPRS